MTMRYAKSVRVKTTKVKSFYVTLAKIVFINSETIGVLLPDICKHTIVIFNKDVIPIMFYGVLIQRYNPVLFAYVNGGIEDITIEHWELPDLDGSDYEYYKIIYSTPCQF